MGKEKRERKEEERRRGKEGDGAGAAVAVAVTKRERERVHGEERGRHTERTTARRGRSCLAAKPLPSRIPSTSPSPRRSRYHRRPHCELSPSS
ncbi:uncharacterized protein DS421_3g88710 [Arachis hypogaea]|nr:uncharacterized protein DS421_3g88710 [Arachis hypogaea]